MKRFIFAAFAVLTTALVWAAPSCTLSGFPVTKKSKSPVVGALVTLSEVGYKDNKFQRMVGEAGFTMVVPYGEYNMTIEREGYEPYTLYIELDDTNIDLGVIRMFTLEQAEERDNAKAKKKGGR